MKGIDYNKKKSIMEKQEEAISKTSQAEPLKKKSIFDKWGEKFREFLDNAE